MAEAKMGAKVMWCGHDGWFVADIHRVGNVNVVRANGEMNAGNLMRGQNELATHHVSDFPHTGFWGRDVGIFVVPEEQVTELKPNGKSKDHSKLRRRGTTTHQSKTNA